MQRGSHGLFQHHMAPMLKGTHDHWLVQVRRGGYDHQLKPDVRNPKFTTGGEANTTWRTGTGLQATVALVVHDGGDMKAVALHAEVEVEVVTGTPQADDRNTYPILSRNWCGSRTMQRSAQCTRCSEVAPTFQQKIHNAAKGSKFSVVPTAGMALQAHVGRRVRLAEGCDELLCIRCMRGAFELEILAWAEHEACEATGLGKLMIAKKPRAAVWILGQHARGVLVDFVEGRTKRVQREA
mmetsp:Transcript_143270/g.457768  ORF Transcript_143270/g.457768 Transcript_143270/m.457768 type:complete len:239 (+) Transcript_143270:250-966(+)